MERSGPRVLITGATGYVGGRLLAALEAGCWRLRCLAREPAALRGRVAATTEVVHGDCLEPASLAGALRGVDTAFYLVHSMGRGDEFAQRDRQGGPRTSRGPRRAAGVRPDRLSGRPGQRRADGLSAHLQQPPGDRRARSPAPACPSSSSEPPSIVGSGCLSFELVRALVERLPVMLCPRWVRCSPSPSPSRTCLAYLAGRPGPAGGESGVFEIGGPDVVSYGDLMRELARQRGLRRIADPESPSSPPASPASGWAWSRRCTHGWAPADRQPAQPYHRALGPAPCETFAVRPRPLRDAIARALQQEKRVGVRPPAGPTHFPSSALHPIALGAAPPSCDGLDSRARVAAVRSQAFAPIRTHRRRAGTGTGGTRSGACAASMDLLAGGVGMRRGRRIQSDCPSGTRSTGGGWRRSCPTACCACGRRCACPAAAWLEFEVAPQAPSGRTSIRQTALFEPRGLAGPRLLVRAATGPRADLPGNAPRIAARRCVPPTARPFLSFRSRVFPQKPAPGP